MVDFAKLVHSADSLLTITPLLYSKSDDLRWKSNQELLLNDKFVCGFQTIIAVFSKQGNVDAFPSTFSSYNIHVWKKSSSITV
jgi:hypothetical protein